MNNISSIMWAQLILDNKAAIEDVPAQLQAGVDEVVDYFTKTVEPAKSKPAATAPASTATTVATTGQSDADQAIDDANQAVEDATK